MSNKKFGKYEAQTKVGEGGFGVVYRGFDPVLDRPVAIKVLRSEISGMPDFVKRFQKEARMAASLRHANIVTMLDAGEQDGYYFIVMDYLDGQPLSKLLEKGKPMPTERALKLLKQLADALDYAHSCSLVHRDIKPSNVIVVGERPVITDFGLVKSSEERGLTTTGMTLGTPEYMAPEQILGKEVEPATDQYALAILAFQMLTGRVPFEGNTPFEVQRAQTENAVPDPREYAPNLPESVKALFEKALAKKPKERFTTISQFVNNLQAALQAKGGFSGANLVRQARESMEKNDFDTALELIQVEVGRNPSAEAIELQNECERRKKVQSEAAQIESSIQSFSARLKKIQLEESWMHASIAVPPALNIVTGGKVGEKVSLQSLKRKVMAIFIFSLIMMLGLVAASVFSEFYYYGFDNDDIIYMSAAFIFLCISTLSIFIYKKFDTIATEPEFKLRNYLLIIRNISLGITIFFFIAVIIPILMVAHVITNWYDCYTVSHVSSWILLSLFLVTVVFFLFNYLKIHREFKSA